MENTKLFKAVIIILLLINAGTLFFLWNREPPHRPPGERNPGEFLIRELNFNPDQKRQFDIFRNDHHQKVMDLQEKSIELHKSFFDHLQSPETDSLEINENARMLSDNQKQIELVTFYHFKQVRLICTPEQQKKFDAIIQDALRMMSPPPER